MRMPDSKAEIYNRAVSYLAAKVPEIMASAGKAPVLFDANNRPLTPSPYQYSSRAAANNGSLINWRPRRLKNSQAASQRDTINARIIDLVNNDYHAAGLVNTFPVTVIGDGLMPYPTLDVDVLGLTDDQVNDIEISQRRVVSRWISRAGIGGRRFGEIQFLWERCLIQFGESLTLVHMRPQPGRRYQMVLRVISPQRLKTPSDMQTRANLIDGVEVNDDGEPIAVWVKRADGVNSLDNNSTNFHRIQISRGHRYMVLHDFYAEDPEQVRGKSPLTPVVKGFKDLSDFLDAELVSNVVTAAFALFIELSPGSNPLDAAGNMSAFYDTAWTGQKTETTRYQHLDPGSIMYGNKGEKPHPIAANRPGATFEPFVRELRKAFAHAVGVPYTVAFHDMDGVSFAGFRSAMLEAWRVFMYRRNHIGRGPAQIVYNMLQEEAFLMGDVPVPGGMSFFYENLDALCACEWYGAPKGDIEPYKAVTTDLLAHDGNIKTLERIILESGGGTPAAVIRQVEQEKKDLAARGITRTQNGKTVQGLDAGVNDTPDDKKSGGDDDSEDADAGTGEEDAA
jgi:lambda family phage portal protein